MVFSWYSYKVWKLDYHEVSVKELFHGMKKMGRAEITMRKRRGGNIRVRILR